MEAALATCPPNEETFIIGGASLYAEALPLADRMEITHVANTPAEADVFFPEINPSVWELISEEKKEGNPAFAFATYHRKKQP